MGRAGRESQRHGASAAGLDIPEASDYLLPARAHPKRTEAMAYKLDGAKFPTLDDLVEALYPLYADKMSEEEFRKYVEANAEKS
jgi:hypothetical protein